MPIMSFILSTCLILNIYFYHQSSTQSLNQLANIIDNDNHHLQRNNDEVRFDNNKNEIDTTIKRF